jgi:glycosyltransferase involved in cell wall biosynthesis
MAKPRRVLYVAKYAEGGSAFSLYYLVTGLDKTQYEPIVLFYAQKDPYIVNKLREAGIRTIILEEHSPGEPTVSSNNNSKAAVTTANRPSGGIKSRLETYFGQATGQFYLALRACYDFVRQDILKVWPIIRIIKENDIDFVHVNSGLRGSKSGILAAWLTNLPCVCHERMFHELTSFDRIFSKFVDYFIYISRAIAEHCATQGIPADKGVVIHNAVDLTEFSQIYDSLAVRSEFNWTNQEQLVGIIGRLDWWKGHEYFLEAVAKVSQQMPNLRGLIVGAPETSLQNQIYYQKLQVLTKSLDIEDNITFTGFRGDIPRLLMALDVVVLSSATPEPFGRVVIEGMAAGKPVIATAVGGVLDIIEDGINGVLVPCKDSQAIADAISWLLSNQAKSKQIGEAARMRVVEKFTVEQHVTAIQNVYQTLNT